MVKTGKKWNPQEAVQHAQGTLHHRDIIGQVQSGRAGFGLGDSWKAKLRIHYWRAGRTSFVREQEEETRGAAAASQVKQGQWLWTLATLNLSLEPLMMSSQLCRTSVSGWVKTEAASCV